MPGSVFLRLAPAIALLLAGSANAAVLVIGNSKAHECYLAAKSGVGARAGINLCSSALEDGMMLARDVAATHVNRGVMLDAVGRYDEALDDYNHSISIEPSLGDAYLNRGVALIRLKQFEEALADVRKGIDLGVSEQAIGYYDLAVAEEDMGRIKEAYYDYKHALELAPGYAPASEALKHFIVTRKPAAPGGT